MTVLIQGRKRPALSEGSRLCWALPSPVHERSGYRASRPTGYKVMRSLRIVTHGPVLASPPAGRYTRAHCGPIIVAPSSSRSRPLTRRLRRWPPASLDRASLRRKRSPPTNDPPLTTHSPYKDEGIRRRPWIATLAPARPRTPRYQSPGTMLGAMIASRCSGRSRLTCIRYSSATRRSLRLSSPATVRLSSLV